jgi:2-polyprenyl-6-methoxyphenol hydroxylase and related FAD-dependent oxidoreductases
MVNYAKYSLAALALSTSCAASISAFQIQPKTNSNSISSSRTRSLANSPLSMSSTIEAPVRKPETSDRVKEVRERFQSASRDAANARGCASPDQTNDWWRTPEDESYREVTKDRPLRVIIAGGGVAGLVTAAACHAKGMKVAIFEQASQYAPYGGPIQIQSNALRALERINPIVYEEIVKAGTVTADRVSGLKIGYKKGVFMGLGKQYEKGDWLVKFDTLQPALQAGLPPTVVVDRPVIQQILLNHGIPDGTVRIKSRIKKYEELGSGKGLKVRTFVGL